MTPESITLLLKAPFEGRVVPQLHDPNSKYTDFNGNPTILYPWSEEGLQHAVKLWEAKGEKGFVRSGLSSSGDGLYSADGGLVIDLSHFSEIEVMEPTSGDGDSVIITVGAAIKNSNLVDVLVQNNAFLPIGDNPVKSVVSSILSDETGYFDRSMGRLRDYVEYLHVITPQGEAMRVKKGDQEFDSILDSTWGAIIKAITFSATPASQEAVLVMRASFVYSHEDFNDAISLLHHEDIQETMDISVHAYHDVVGLIIVSVTLAGQPKDQEQMDAILDRLISLYSQRLGNDWSTEQIEQVVRRVEARSPAEIVALILEGGLSGNPYIDRNLTCKRYKQMVPQEDLDSFRITFAADLVSTFPTEGESNTPEMISSVRLNLTNEGTIVVNTVAFLLDTQTEAETQFASFIGPSFGTLIQSEAYIATLERDRGKEISDLDFNQLKSVSPQGEARRIPGFDGLIYAPGDRDYDAKRTQYASSSYPAKQRPGGSMRPFLVAYPQNNEKDVKAAIEYAIAEKKHVVARSGGHQYSGLSSGGEDTILLSMDLFNDLEVKEIGNKTYARVGVGRLLTDIAAAFKKKGVTIPHGECPRVGIGGHVQTGGYGHIIRSYGLTIDHVHEFKIYLHDGGWKVVKRPAVRDENSLYWGVLGGGPGSFGILTEVTFECIRDVDHPNSWGSVETILYGKNLFLGAMKEAKRWTEQIGSSDLPPDVDISLTVINILGSSGFGVLLLEMVNGNKDGGNGDRNRKFLLDAQKRILAYRKWFNRKVPGGYEGNYPLSVMSDRKVRRTGTTADGREFAEPYKKRLNGTRKPLSSIFINRFVDLVDRVVKSRWVKLVFQMNVGGGAYASPMPNPPLNAICHRDVTVGIVFDCFYIGERGLKEADEFQAEMQKLLSEFSSDQEIRMLWGSFGDTDISKVEVRKFYYDEATWSSLQKLKQQEDKDDLFHTEFTVQLPKDDSDLS